MSGKNVRLCIVTPYQSGGGAEYQIACLVRALAAKGGWDVHLLTAHADESAIDYPARVHVIGPGSGTPRLGYLSHWRQLQHAFESIRPQVVYQRVACGYTGLCAAYGQRNRIPVFWHVAHDSDVSADASIFGGNPLRRALEKRSVEYGLRRVSHIVTQTRRQAALLKANYGREEVAVVPNFHPLPLETRISAGDRVRILWIANFKQWKRPDVFVRLAAACGSHPEAEFLMVGAMPANEADRVWTRPLADAIAATPNLRHLGSLPQAEVNRLLADADLLVNTSTEEGFPNTFIQAWMRGIPVVSLDVDPDGVIERQQIGWVARTETQLVEFVRRAIAEPDLRERAGSQARAYALEAHSLANTDRLADLMCKAVIDVGGRTV